MAAAKGTLNLVMDRILSDRLHRLGTLVHLLAVSRQ
jgi:hypothetical protein